VIGVCATAHDEAHPFAEMARNARARSGVASVGSVRAEGAILQNRYGAISPRARTYAARPPHTSTRSDSVAVTVKENSRTIKRTKTCHSREASLTSGSRPHGKYVVDLVVIAKPFSLTWQERVRQIHGDRRSIVIFPLARGLRAMS